MSSQVLHIRVSDDIHERLKERAKADYRSVNYTCKKILEDAVNCEHHISGNKCLKCGRIF